MKREKVSVRIIGNNEISKEDGATIWDMFFNIMKRKELQNESYNKKFKVGSEEIIKNINEKQEYVQQ